MIRLPRILLPLLPALAMAGDGHDRRLPADCVKAVSGAHGGAIDRSVLAQTSTVVGGVVFSQRTIECDGSDDYVHFPDHDRLSFTDGSGTDRPFSCSAWVYLDSTAGYRAVLAKEDYNGSTGTEWVFLILNGKLLGSVSMPNGSTAKVRTGNTTTLSTATWYHVAFTYSGSETLAGIKLFVNGVEEAAYSVITDSVGYTGMSNTTAKFYLGISSGTMGTNYYDLDGKLAGVLVFSRELSATEIKILYAEGRP